MITQWSWSGISTPTWLICSDTRQCPACSAKVHPFFFGNGDNNPVTICAKISRGSGRANTGATRSTHPASSHVHDSTCATTSSRITSLTPGRTPARHSKFRDPQL